MDPSTHLPIADLSPSLVASSATSIHGVVTLIWPYSASTRSFAFLLAEPDVRLRQSKGQVRVVLNGSSAKAVAKTHLGIGDVVNIALEGNQLKQHNENVRTPGKALEWDLEFEERLVLEIHRDGTQVANVDIDHPPLSPPPQLPLPMQPFLRSQGTPNARESVSIEDPGTWRSPAFLKHPRVSSGPFFNTSYDPFAEDDGYILGKGRKRTRLSPESDSRRSSGLVSTPTRTTGAIGLLITDSENENTDMGEEPSTAPATWSTMEDAQTQTTFATAEDDMDAQEEDTNMEQDMRLSEPVQPSNIAKEISATEPERLQAVSEQTILRVETSVEKMKEARRTLEPDSSTLLVEDGPASVEESRLSFEAEDDDETPGRMPTPRLYPLASPGLPLISPLITRAGPPGSYFPFEARNKSELDDISSTPVTRLLPPLPKASGNEPDQPTKEVPEQQSEDVFEGSHQQGEREESEEESEESYEEEPAGTVQFEDTTIHAIDFHEEDDEDEVDPQSEREEEMIGRESSSEFEGFSTPGEQLRQADDEDEDMDDIDRGAHDDDEVDEGDEDASEPEDGSSEEKQRVIRPEMGIKQPRATLAAPEEDEIEDDEERDSVADGENSQLNGEEQQSESDQESSGVSDDISQDDEDTSISRVNHGKVENVSEASEEEGSDESESEMSEEPVVNKSRDSGVVEIIDLTSDDDEETQIKKIEIEEPEEQDKTMEDPSEIDDRDELEKEGDAGISSGVSSTSASQDRDNLAMSPKHRRDDLFDEEDENEDEDSYYDSDNQMDDESSRRSPYGLEGNDDQDGDVSYPELPLEDADRSQINSLADIAKKAATGADALVDPALSTQLMTPSATASASQLTAMLSRQSTALTYEDEHLPTPESSQYTNHTTKLRPSYSSLDGGNEEIPEPRRTSRRMSTRLTLGGPSTSLLFECQESAHFQVIETSSIESEVEEDSESRSLRGEEVNDRRKQEMVVVTAERETTDIKESSLFLPPVEKFFEGPRGFTTPRGYFPTLSSLHSHFNKTIDVLAVSTTKVVAPVRAKKGPKDYFITLTLSDPSHLSQKQPGPHSLTIAQVFRPWPRALPPVGRGDILLLRGFKVQSQKRKLMLLSTDESSWVVFKNREGALLEQKEYEVAPGPPVEFGAEERGFARGLKDWWVQVGERAYPVVEGDGRGDGAESGEEGGDENDDASGKRDKNKYTGPEMEQVASTNGFIAVNMMN